MGLFGGDSHRRTAAETRRIYDRKRRIAGVRSLSLRVRFTDRTIHPMHAFVSEDDRFGPTRLLQWNVTTRETSLMVFQVAGPEEPYTTELAQTPNVRSYETVSMAGRADQFTVFVEDAIDGGGRGIFEAYDDENVVIVPPVVFHPNRTADLQLIGPNAALSELVNRLPEGMDAEIRRLTTGGGTQVSVSDELTARQRRVLTTAFRVGYYDEPRDATVADVAAQLDLATGTVAEHMRKAEAALVEHALGDGWADERVEHGTT